MHKRSDPKLSGKRASDHSLNRTISRSLAGFLCGTQSGVLRFRRRDRLPAKAIPRAHAQLRHQIDAEQHDLGAQRWHPEGRAALLAQNLRGTLDHEDVVDLIVFGSQARGGTTGFSDVDAILVINDGAAERPRTLAKLRRQVISAQRAVLAYQPMQHHGFEVATPKLLESASATLAMPRVALREARSLFGRGALAHFAAIDGGASARALRDLVSSMLAARSWPAHPWSLHRLVSVFELLPTLYLQAQGQEVPKWESFSRARTEFGDTWWPYDVLLEVRRSWLITTDMRLRVGITLSRNPWLAIDVWRRLPVGVPSSTRALLTAACLQGLQELARAMEVGAG